MEKGSEEEEEPELHLVRMYVVLWWRWMGVMKWGMRHEWLCLWYSYAACCTKELSEPFFFEAIAMKQLSLSLDIITSSGFKFYFLFIRFFSNFFINYFSQFIINVTNYSIICISLVRIIENNYYFLIIH